GTDDDGHGVHRSAQQTGLQRGASTLSECGDGREDEDEADDDAGEHQGEVDLPARKASTGDRSICWWFSISISRRIASSSARFSCGSSKTVRWHTSCPSMHRSLLRMWAYS